MIHHETCNHKVNNIKYVHRHNKINRARICDTGGVIRRVKNSAEELWDDWSIDSSTSLISS